MFREKEEKLALAKAVEIATAVEEAVNTAKAQVYSRPVMVKVIHTKKPQRNHHHHYQKSPPPTKLSHCTTAGDTFVERTAMRWRTVVCLTQFATFSARKDTTKQPVSPSIGHPKSTSSQRLPSTL